MTVETPIIHRQIPADQDTLFRLIDYLWGEMLDACEEGFEDDLDNLIASEHPRAAAAYREWIVTEDES